MLRAWVHSTPQKCCSCPRPGCDAPRPPKPPNANSRILGYRQSLSKIDKPFLTMLDKLCLHFFCSCLQLSVLTRFVCRICLHFDPGFGGFLQTKFVYRICLHFGPGFGGFFADKVCLQDLSAFWPGFGGFSADKVCLQSLSVRTSCADKVCLQNRCRQSLSACPRVRLQHPPDDKLCLR